MGTAFLACEESGTTKEHRGILFSGRTYSTTLTRAYTGRLARGMPNRLVEVMTAHAGQLPPFPVQAWFVSRLKQAAVDADERISSRSTRGRPLRIFATELQRP